MSVTPAADYYPAIKEALHSASCTGLRLIHGSEAAAWTPPNVWRCEALRQTVRLHGHLRGWRSAPRVAHCKCTPFPPVKPHPTLSAGGRSIIKPVVASSSLSELSEQAGGRTTTTDCWHEQIIGMPLVVVVTLRTPESHCGHGKSHAAAESHRAEVTVV